MRRIVIGVAALALLGVLLWWFRTDTGEPVDELERKRVVVQRLQLPVPTDAASAPSDPLDPELLKDVVRGEHGIELANRVCAVCASGDLESDACGRCPEDGPRGRIYVDVVDAAGRAFDDHDVSASVLCQGSQRWWSAGALNDRSFVDVPAGDCTVSARRYQGPFMIQGESVPLTLEPGVEAHIEIVLPSETWGGIGVTMARDDNGLVIDSVVPGTAAEGLVPVGAAIVAIDGRTEGLVTPSELASALLGPEGSEVEVTYRIDGPDGPEEETVVLDRRNYPAGSVGLGKGPAG